MKRWILAMLPALVSVGCGGADGPGGDVVGRQSVTLQQVQDSIFTTNCALSGCHLGGGAPFGLDLSQGAAFGNTVGISSAEMPAFDRIEPGDPADSYVYMKVSGDLRILGDQMPPPSVAVPLSAQKQELLAEWIQQGANP